MTSLPPCPKCSSEYVYEDAGHLVCPECAHEWTPGEEAAHDEEKLVVKDANGTLLADGDSVTIVKTLKVKGASTPLKIGTKVKNIRLVEGDHNIDCRIDGFGAMQLKSEFVKKLCRPARIHPDAKGSASLRFDGGRRSLLRLRAARVFRTISRPYRAVAARRACSGRALRATARGTVRVRALPLRCVRSRSGPCGLRGPSAVRPR